MTKTTIIHTGWCAACAALAACAAAEVTPDQRAAAERRLLAPFLAPLEVGCGELTIELTGNFHPNVGQPGVDRTRHKVERRETDDAVVTTWTNLSGDPDAAFVVTVGEPQQLAEDGLKRGRETRFIVVNQLRVRVLQGRRPLTLTARAGGDFVFVREAAAPVREVRQFEVADGTLRAL